MGMFISQFIELYTYMFGRNLPKVACGELDPKSNCRAHFLTLCVSELKQFIKKKKKKSKNGKKKKAIHQASEEQSRRQE